MTWLKSILCVWASLQLVLPGCLCQLLEPLGIDVPHHHHHHGTFVRQENPGPCHLKAPPPPTNETEIPCHCDERPDRTTDETLANICPEAPNVDDCQWVMLSSWERIPSPTVLRIIRQPGRGPPHDGMVSAEESRIARCVHLL